MGDVCYRTKQSRLQFHVSHNKAKDLFEIMHYDVWGLYRVPSSCRAHYFLILADDASQEVWLYLMKRNFA